jgi:gamma-polyglutamate biosynthesis protein CapC
LHLLPTVGLDVGPTLSAVILSIGLLGSLICYLTTNLSPGGLVVPGWLALTVAERPQTLPVGIGATVCTYGIMKLVSQYTILYGKRLFAATVLVGVLVQVDAFLTLADLYPGLFPNDTLDLIVPGLIAYQVGKQRVLPTLVSLISVAAASCVLLTVGVALS